MSTIVKQETVQLTKESLPQRVYRYLFGDDVFISYSRADASDYAPALAARLNKYICYLDQLGTSPGEQISPHIINKIHRSTVLVLVGTTAAAASDAVEDEIREFLKTGRPIIPINVDQALVRASWYGSVIRGMALADESREAVKSAIPSDAVVKRIENSFKYTRRSTVLRTMLLGTVLFVLAAVGSTIGWSRYRIRDAEIRAADETRKATEAEERTKAARLNEAQAIQSAAQARTAADAAEQKRIEAVATAQTATKEARDQKKLADGFAQDAKVQQALAIKNGKIADEQRKVADEQKKLADEQKKLAEVQVERNAQLTYVGDIKVASQRQAEWNIPEMTQVLNSYLPTPAKSTHQKEREPDRRGYEWYYLWRHTHNTGTTLSGHKGFVRAVLYSPNGKLIVTAGDDGAVKLWNPLTGKEISKLVQYSSPITAVSFLPNSNKLAIPLGSSMAIWDVATKKQIAILPEGSGSWIFTFSPDGKILATAHGKIAKLWSMENYKELATLDTQRGDIRSVSFSPDGKILATGSEGYTMGVARYNRDSRLFDPNAPPVDPLPPKPAATLYDAEGTVKLWDTQTFKEVGTLPGNLGFMYAVAFSPDGKLLATGNKTGQLKLWDTRLNKEWATLPLKCVAPVEALAFSPDSSMLAAACFDTGVILWDVITGQELAAIKQRIPKYDGIGAQFMAFSPQGDTLLTVSGESTARLWSLKTLMESAPITDHTEQVATVAFSHDGKLLATGSWDGTVKVRDPMTRKVLFTINDDRPARAEAVAFSPNDDILAIAFYERVKLWNVKTNKEITTLNAKSASFLTLSFSHDGKMLAGASTDHLVWLWDVNTFKELRVLRGHSSTVVSAVFTVGDKTLISSSTDKTVRLWHIDSGENFATFTPDPEEYTNLEISPDGTYFVTNGPDGTIKLWDVETLKELATLKGQRTRAFRFAISPDGKTIATAFGTIQLWDVASRQEITTLRGHNSTICALAFSPDSRTLVSGSFDKTARVWYGAGADEIPRPK